MTTTNAPGLYLDSGEFIPASELAVGPPLAAGRAAAAKAVAPPNAITASIMRDDGGEAPVFCLMAAYRSEKDAMDAFTLIAAAPAKPAAQHYGPLRDADAEHGKQLSVYSTPRAQPAAQQPHRSGCTAGTDEECVQRGCGTNCPAVSPRQGVAYAALPEPFIGVQDRPWGGHAEVIRAAIGEEGVVSCFTVAQMRAFADATCALRGTPAQYARGFEAARAQFASHGQAPADSVQEDAAPTKHVDIYELRAVLCGIGVVGRIDGHSVIRRDSVIEMIDRRMNAARKQGGAT